MRLGHIVHEYRKANDITMDEFAKLSGLSKSYISMLEKNVNPRNNKPISPSMATLKSVANAMGMDPNDLFNQLDDDQKVMLNHTENDHSAAQELVNTIQAAKQLESDFPEGFKMIRRAATKLSDKEKEKLLQIMKAYIADDEEDEPENK